MNLLQYIREVKAELFHVTWPSRKEAYQLTLVILVVSLIVGLYVGGLDVLLTNLLGIVLK